MKQLFIRSRSRNPSAIASVALRAVFALLTPAAMAASSGGLAPAPAPSGSQGVGYQQAAPAATGEEGRLAELFYQIQVLQQQVLLLLVQSPKDMRGAG